MRTEEIYIFEWLAAKYGIGSQSEITFDILVNCLIEMRKEYEASQGEINKINAQINSKINIKFHPVPSNTACITIKIPDKKLPPNRYEEEINEYLYLVIVEIENLNRQLKVLSEKCMEKDKEIYRLSSKKKWWKTILGL